MSHVTDPRIEQELQVVRLNSFEHLNTVYNEVPPKKLRLKEKPLTISIGKIEAYSKEKLDPIDEIRHLFE
ncbi:hypothetical protein BLOT_015651 [Blomia tropicalis]|nr:hypothetical protein BLOT_015651 [Blomia tropicalis]